VRRCLWTLVYLLLFSSALPSSWRPAEKVDEAVARIGDGLHRPTLPAPGQHRRGFRDKAFGVRRKVSRISRVLVLAGAPPDVFI
jgi:hypothetical protein